MGFLPDDQVLTVDGIPVTSLARTAVDLSRSARDWRQAVVDVDAALRAGADLDEVRAVAELCRAWSGARTTARAVALAAAGSESPGETLARLLVVGLGFPAPVTQAVVRDRKGGFVARVDLLLEAERVVIEFDGRVKYRAAAGDPEGPEDVLWREKRHEDQLRELGYEVVRLSWADLSRPDRVRGLVRAATARGASRPRPAAP